MIPVSPYFVGQSYALSMFVVVNMILMIVLKTMITSSSVNITVTNVPGTCFVVFFIDNGLERN